MMKLLNCFSSKNSLNCSLGRVIVIGSEITGKEENDYNVTKCTKTMKTWSIQRMNTNRWVVTR